MKSLLALRRSSKTALRKIAAKNGERPRAARSTGARASPASSTTLTPRRRKTSCARSEKRDLKTQPSSGRCCSPSTICRSSPSAPGRCCSTAPRSTSSSWRCAAPTRSSATPCSLRCRRGDAVWSRANSLQAASAPPREIAKARKAIAEIVLGMAARNEIELIRAGRRGGVTVATDALNERRSRSRGQDRGADRETAA